LPQLTVLAVNTEEAKLPPERAAANA